MASNSTTNQAAIITGASSGIGLDIASELASRGYQTVLIARREQNLKDLAEKLSSAYNCKSLILAADLTDRHTLNGLMANTQAWFETERLTPTILVNNAGSGVWEYFAQQDPGVIQRDIDLNVTALTTLSHEFIQTAIEHGERAYILNIASVAAFLPAPGFAVYSGTKSYVKRLSETLRYELRNSNIRVSCSCPGGTHTEFLEHAGQELKGNTGMMTSADVARLSVQAMFDEKTVYVPGLLNKLALLGRILPDSTHPGLVERSMMMTVKKKS